MPTSKFSSDSLFTSESVSRGHPDKLADAISDSVLDDILAQDKNGRSAIETLVSGNRVIIAGEYRALHEPDFEAIARQTIIDAGYDDDAKSFNGYTCKVDVAVIGQSPDIAAGVENSYEVRNGNSDDRYDSLGAGDQGLMFGGAVRETIELMPAPISLAHRIIRRMEQLHDENRSNGDWLLYPDAKTQVTIRYREENGVIVPDCVDTIVLSTQHAESASDTWIHETVRERVLTPVLEQFRAEQRFLGNFSFDIDNVRLLINPTGRFVIGGPLGDAGLTGRKIIVDTYGGYFRHGGGAFSGKDYTKVDRSAAYAARWVANNLVAAGLADKAEIQIAYAIGVASPVSVRVDSFETGVVPDARLAEIVDDVFDLRPLAIREQLKLDSQRYLPTATGGHFGRYDEGSFSWEGWDKLSELENATRQ